jgi:hypothetical protein
MVVDAAIFRIHETKRDGFRRQPRFCFFGPELTSRQIAYLIAIEAKADIAWSSLKDGYLAFLTTPEAKGAFFKL